MDRDRQEDSGLRALALSLEGADAKMSHPSQLQPGVPPHPVCPDPPRLTVRLDKIFVTFVKQKDLVVKHLLPKNFKNKQCH